MSQSRILKIAFVVVVAVNLWGALPGFHYAPWTNVSRRDVRVYTPHSTSSDTVPVQGVVTSTGYEPFQPTGQMVDVYIRSDYQNRDHQTYPRITLTVVLVAIAILIIIRLWNRGPEQKSNQALQPTAGRSDV